jgi:anti-anti-sigma factor
MEKVSPFQPPLESWPLLALDVVTRDGTRVVVALRGELDLSVAGHVGETLDEILATGAVDVAVDLRELRFLDAAGVTVLAGAARAARELGGGLVITGAAGIVRRILYLTDQHRLLGD